MKRPAFVLAALAAAMLPAAAARSTAGASADALVFVVSSRQPATGFSSAQLRQVFLGRVTRWKDGRRIVLAIRPATVPAGRAFFDRVVEMSDIDFSQRWLGIIFRGEAAASPRVLQSGEEAKRFVSKSPDALTFLLASEIDPGDSSIRRLLVDGLRPEEPSYPLRLP